VTAPNHIRATENLAPLIRRHADEAERIRRLPQPVARAFARNGLYRLAGTPDIHGADADPMTQIGVIEAASRADGSAGWNLMIGIETFGIISAGFHKCPDLIADPMTVMASSTAAVGRAERVADGWRVNGQWQFASGVHNAQIFGATVRLYDGEELLDEGNRYAVVPEGEFEIVDTWHVAGLRGSGSHDVRLDDVYVPDSRIIAPIGGNEATTPQLRLPLGNRLAYNKAAVAIGIAQAGLDAFVDLATRKQPRFTTRTLRDRPFAQRAVANAEARLIGARAALLDRTAARRTGSSDRLVIQAYHGEGGLQEPQKQQAVTQARAGGESRQEPLERQGKTERAEPAVLPYCTPPGCPSASIPATSTPA